MAVREAQAQMRQHATLDDVADILFGVDTLPGWIKEYESLDPSIYESLWLAYERGRDQVGQLHRGAPVWIEVSVGGEIWQTGRSTTNTVAEYEQMLISRGAAMEGALLNGRLVELRSGSGYETHQVEDRDVLLLRAQLEGTKAAHAPSDDYRPLQYVDEVLDTGVFDQKARKQNERDRLKFLLRMD